MMSQLYIGNLPNEASESTLRELFAEHGITASSVVIKRGGYGFFDCAETTDFDNAVSSVNGKYFIVILISGLF